MRLRPIPHRDDDSPTPHRHLFWQHEWNVALMTIHVTPWTDGWRHLRMNLSMRAVEHYLGPIETRPNYRGAWQAVEGMVARWRWLWGDFREELTEWSKNRERSHEEAVAAAFELGRNTERAETLRRVAAFTAEEMRGLSHVPDYPGILATLSLPPHEMQVMRVEITEEWRES